MVGDIIGKIKIGEQMEVGKADKVERITNQTVPSLNRSSELLGPHTRQS